MAAASVHVAGHTLVRIHLVDATCTKHSISKAASVSKLLRPWLPGSVGNELTN